MGECHGAGAGTCLWRAGDQLAGVQLDLRLPACRTATVPALRSRGGGGPAAARPRAKPPEACGVCAGHRAATPGRTS
jgi:hypothetical protein